MVPPLPEKTMPFLTSGPALPPRTVSPCCPRTPPPPSWSLRGKVSNGVWVGAVGAAVEAASWWRLGGGAGADAEGAVALVSGLRRGWM